MPALPPLVAWTLGAIGAVVVMKLINREWQRINAELDQARPVRVTDPGARAPADASSRSRDRRVPPVSLKLLRAGG